MELKTTPNVTILRVILYMSTEICNKNKPKELPLEKLLTIKISPDCDPSPLGLSK